MISGNLLLWPHDLICTCVITVTEDLWAYKGVETKILSFLLLLKKNWKYLWYFLNWVPAQSHGISNISTLLSLEKMPEWINEEPENYSKFLPNGSCFKVER